MGNGHQHVEHPTGLRVGAACAVLGAVVSVAAGIGYGELPDRADPEPVLHYLAARPDWYWPAVHLGFMVGALLWVGALVALAGSLAEGSARGLGRLGAAAAVVGAAVHVVDSSLSGAGLAALAAAWDAAPADRRADLLRDAEALLGVLAGTWAGVVTFFHGLPFALVGAAVVLDRRAPAWLGWVGLAGGLGSLAVGPAMFLGAEVAPEWLFVVFALVVSLWMVAMGGQMWRRGDTAATAPLAPRPATA